MRKHRGKSTGETGRRLLPTSQEERPQIPSTLLTPCSWISLQTCEEINFRWLSHLVLCYSSPSKLIHRIYAMTTDREKWRKPQMPLVAWEWWAGRPFIQVEAGSIKEGDWGGERMQNVEARSLGATRKAAPVQRCSTKLAHLTHSHRRPQPLVCSFQCQQWQSWKPTAGSEWKMLNNY